ncbi:tellurite resistance TerB family protein [Pseudomonas sp. SIMBA_077]
MNTRGLLDQLLKSGQELLEKKTGTQHTGASDASANKGGLGDLLGGGKLGGLLSGAGGGAMAASVFGLLLGSKRGRKYGGKALTYGGLAALGVLAYKAYGNWQANQGKAPEHPPQTIDRVPAVQAEEHSQAILKALVAAAKADGHIDERERNLIEDELSKLNSDQPLQEWLKRELNKPLDPAEVARAATTPEIAAEMYIASLILIDEEAFGERAYLDELAKQLKLDPALVVELQTQVKEAQA